ncbi:MAG: hypothetical protein RIR18_1876 [Pseudomonadota bacterium]|jgi:FAD/FMN-containing dehydrogenase
MNTEHIARFVSLVGDKHVLTGNALAPLLSDWRGRYQGQAMCAVYPKNTAEVSAVVRYCHNNRLAMVPQGGNTSLCGAATPDSTGQAVLICLSRLKSIRQIDAINHTLTVEAGVTLADVQQAADGIGQLFPLTLASEGSCQIGGNLSTNAGGVQVLRYGNTRDLTLGLEVVLPNGDIWDGLRALRKDNTGYDLKHLFIGAEGTLGIITAAVLKLFPKPTAQVTTWIDLPTPASAINLLNTAQATFANELTAFELVSYICLNLVLQHFPNTRKPTTEHSPWSVLCEFSAQNLSDFELRSKVENFFGELFESGLITDAVIAQNETQAQALWALRENISDAQKIEGFSIKHDIAVPVSSIPEFLRTTGEILNTAYPNIRIVAFGHAGDGNLHYNLSSPASANDKGRNFLNNQTDINQRVHDQVARFNGSISAEHGLGQLKHDEILRYKSPVEMTLMHSIKKALDPQGLMNPGKVLCH